jgi:hypothetical protein
MARGATPDVGHPISLRCAEEMKDVLRQAKQQREGMTKAQARDD